MRFGYDLTRTADTWENRERERRRTEDAEQIPAYLREVPADPSGEDVHRRSFRG
jgi:hypothetical protein